MAEAATPPSPLAPAALPASTQAPAALDALRAPSLGDIEALADAAFARLPEAFRAACQGVAFRVEEFATDEVLAELDLDDPFDLMGLYAGAPLTQRSHADAPQAPDMVVLYRRALLDYWAEHDETLGALITHVLVHEIGHHMGLSDEAMAAIEASVREDALEPGD